MAEIIARRSIIRWYDGVVVDFIPFASHPPHSPYNRLSPKSVPLDFYVLCVIGHVGSGRSEILGIWAENVWLWCVGCVVWFWVVHCVFLTVHQNQSKKHFSNCAVN